MPVRPARTASASAAVPQPAALTAPMPVTTTRAPALLGTRDVARVAAEAPLDEGAEVRHGPEDAAVDVGAVDGDPELLFQRHHELERVHGVEAEAFAEEPLVVE